MASKKLQAASAGDMRRLIKWWKRTVWWRRIWEDWRGRVCKWRYSDASFGKVEGGKSQIGYIIGLRDRSEERCPLVWKSNVGKRVARSTIEAEAIGFGEALEITVFLWEIWREMSGEEVTIVGKIDSKTLERAIGSTTGKVTED